MTEIYFWSMENFSLNEKLIQCLFLKCNGFFFHVIIFVTSENPFNAAEKNLMVAVCEKKEKFTYWTGE